MAFQSKKILLPQGYVCLLQSLEKSYQETCDGIDYSSSDNVCLHYGAAFQNISCPETERRIVMHQPMISQRWRSSLQDVRVMRGADISSDHHLIIAKVKIKLAKGTKVEQKRIKYNVEKLKDLHLKDQFQIELRNRFEVLKDGPDLDINNEWEVGRDIIKEVCEDVLGRKTNKKKDWMSHGTSSDKDMSMSFEGDLMMLVISLAKVRLTGWPAAFYKEENPTNDLESKTPTNDLKSETRQMTPLLYAADIGHLEIVKYLVENGSDKEARDTGRGRTPILWAAQEGHLATLQYLVTQNCDKKERHRDGKTALHYAAGNGHLQVTKWLIEKEGMDPLEMTSTDAKTALHLAAENGALEVTKWLIREARIDPLVKSYPFVRRDKLSSRFGKWKGRLRSPVRLNLENGMVSYIRLYVFGKWYGKLRSPERLWKIAFITVITTLAKS
ncbi:unnamed protein product [Mytilus edulis]|uniref:Uncharacterized protein n=1 Tax=Mytilus edulis TaxID=6550 RepID=A0A8S3VB34_MYTED|nr:unnamed protein product [Mytilus edulis]